MAAPDAFLTADNCEVDPNATQSVQDTFSCLSDFGAQSCGTAEPLEAMRRALGGDPSGGALTGRASFVSPGAELAVVFIAGQDDASARDGALVLVRDYVTFLQSLSTDPLNEIAVSLVGPEGCPAGGAVAPTPTPRLDEIVASVGSNGVALPVCDMSLANALQNLTLSSGVLYKPPCLAGIKDTDPDQPGLQPDCVVEDKIVEADGSEVTRTLPICDPTATVTPCLSLVSAGAIQNCSPGRFASGGAARSRQVCWLPAALDAGPGDLHFVRGPDRSRLLGQLDREPELSLGAGREP